jgi:calmodulin-binding transcription activator
MQFLITGRILNKSQVIERCKWSCMFGEVEVPAEMLMDGSLLCYSPPQKPGRVPFYIACSNRLACSEVREFEFRPTDSQYMDAPCTHGATNKIYFQIHLDKLVSLRPAEYQAISNNSLEVIDLSKKLHSLMMNNDEWSIILKLADGNEISTDDQKDQFAENLIKEKLHAWLLNKVAVGGKGPSVLDDGQGVLHLAAALGYGWAIRLTVSAGVNINFRDVHGWTALHWVSFCGR